MTSLERLWYQSIRNIKWKERLEMIRARKWRSREKWSLRKYRNEVDCERDSDNAILFLSDQSFYISVENPGNIIQFPRYLHHSSQSQDYNCDGPTSRSQKSQVTKSRTLNRSSELRNTETREIWNDITDHKTLIHADATPIYYKNLTQRILRE